MPRLSEMLIIGCLSTDPIPIKPREFLYGGKTVRSHTCPGWLMTLKPEDKQVYQEEILKDVKEGGKVYGTKIVKVYPLEEWKAAYDDSIKFASEGKVMIKMD